LLKLIIQDKSLDDIIQEMQEEAKNRGLTQEILDEILQNG
jgi:calcineurin-like phosphoesterase